MWSAFLNLLRSLVEKRVKKSRSGKRRKEQIATLRDAIAQVFLDMTHVRPHRDVDGHWINRVGEDRAARFDRLLTRLGVSTHCPSDDRSVP